MTRSPADRIVLLTVALGGLACGLALTAMGSLETLMVQELRLSHGLAGLTQSAFFAGNLLGSVVASFLLCSPRPGRIGGAALLLLSTGCALSGVLRYEVIVIGRLMAGLGVSLTVLFFSGVIVQRFESIQGKLLGGLHACIAAGGAAALWTARPLTRATGAFWAPLWLSAALALIPAALALQTPATPLGARARMSPGAAVRIIGSPGVAVTFLLMAGYMIAEQGLTTFFAAYVEQEHSLGGGQFAAVYWLGLGAGRLASAALLDRFSERRQLVFATLCGLLLLLGTLGISSPTALLGASLAAGALLGPVMPLAFSRAAGAVTSLKASAMSMGNAAACLGGGVGPLLMGLAGDASSLRWGLAAGYILGLILAAPFLIQRR